MARPETVVGWHRQGFRRFWAWKSRRRRGRPAIRTELRDLIRRISRANPLWGAPRIHGELLKLGLTVSLAKTSSDSLRSTEIRQSVHRPKTPSLVGDRATGIVRPSALHGHTGVAREDGERAGWAAELDL